MNLLHFETLVASKAARSVLVAPGKLLVDFGLRRAHGAEAGLLAARAAYLAGFSGTLRRPRRAAVRRPGVRHHGALLRAIARDEAAAFEHFARAFPRNALLLIDTYDTVAAARKVATLSPELAREGIAVRGVRLDSGDLAALARASARCSTGPAWGRRPSSPAAISTSTACASSSRRARRSTRSAWARASSPPRTRQVSTPSISCRSTRDSRGASGRRERQPGPAASRSTVTTARTGGSRATSSPRRETCNPASR